MSCDRKYICPDCDCGRSIKVGFSQSYWLRDAINSLAKRDPVDALHDVEFLLRVQQERLNEVQRAAGRL